MKPGTESAGDRQIEAERKLLAALCQTAIDESTRQTILRRLQAHAFAEPDHEVIYRALAAMRKVDSAGWRQALAQAVTRLGFPDVDLDGLFTEAVPTRDEIRGWMERL